MLGIICRTLKLQDRYNATGTYTYDAVFDQETTSEEVYDKCAKERVLSAMQVCFLPLERMYQTATKSEAYLLAAHTLYDGLDLVRQGLWAR